MISYSRMRTCAVETCVSPLRSAELCAKHYARFKRHGSVDTVLPTGVKPKPPEVSYASQLDASRQWKRRNKDRQTEYMRGWRTANPEKLRESHWRGAGVKVGDRYFTQGDYNQAYEEQEGKCLGCSKVVPRFHVDHDHDTDQFRGLLCPSCNVRDVLSL